MICSALGRVQTPNLHLYTVNHLIFCIALVLQSAGRRAFLHTLILRFYSSLYVFRNITCKYVCLTLKPWLDPRGKISKSSFMPATLKCWKFLDWFWTKVKRHTHYTGIKTHFEFGIKVWFFHCLIDDMFLACYNSTCLFNPLMFLMSTCRLWLVGISLDKISV